MKTWKPTLEVLEARALPSGFWDPGPGGGTPVPTWPMGVPILAGKGGTDNINFETLGGAVQIGDEVVFLDQDHWDRGGFEDLDDDPLPGADIVDLTPDDEPEPPAPGGGGGGGGGGILGWLGNLFGGGKNKDEGSQSVDNFFTELSQTSQGVIAPPQFDVPNPGGDQEKLVRPPSQPTTLSDLFHNPHQEISLKPGAVNYSLLPGAKSSDRPAMWGATWTPGYTIFGQPAQYGRETGGQSEISIEFTGAVDPTNPDVDYLRGGAGTKLPVSVPDGGTVLLGNVKTLRSETVDKNETITIGG